MNIAVGVTFGQDMMGYTRSHFTIVFSFAYPKMYLLFRSTTIEISTKLTNI